MCVLFFGSSPLRLASLTPGGSTDSLVTDKDTSGTADGTHFGFQHVSQGTPMRPGNSHASLDSGAIYPGSIAVATLNNFAVILPYRGPLQRTNYVRKVVYMYRSILLLRENTGISFVQQWYLYSS